MTMKNELHNNVSIVRCISPITAGTTGTGRTGVAVDRRGFHGVEFVASYGAITATGATFTVIVQESDSATSASFTSVADADLLGTESAAGVAAATPRTSGTTMNVTKRVGYKGNKRYVRGKIVNTATAGTPVALTCILHSPHLAPVS